MKRQDLIPILTVAAVTAAVTLLLLWPEAVAAKDATLSPMSLQSPKGQPAGILVAAGCEVTATAGVAGAALSRARTPA